MNQPFDLPEGLAWTEPTPEQISYAARGNVPPEDVATLTLTITLRRKADGVERTYVDEWYPFDVHRETRDLTMEAMRYQWQEGNFSCGCNRSLFFARAGDEDDPEDPSCYGAGIVVVAPEWLADA